MFRVIALLLMVYGIPANSFATAKQDNAASLSCANEEGTPVKKIEESNDEWKEKLTPEQYHVLREKGTERAFSGKYYDYHKKGMYKCAACGAVLFDSDAKFDSGTGWPSFYEPVSPQSVAVDEDRSFLMKRVEVHCPKCGGHLGHVFDDGPQPTGKRFCINSAALTFEEKKT